MPLRLKDKNRQIPNGYQYRQPEIPNWQPKARFESFNAIVRQVVDLRRANPFLATQHGWRMDEAGVADDVEQYNVRLCEQMGWTQYLIGGDGSPLPKTHFNPQNLTGSVQQVAAGAGVLVDWITSGAEAVSPSLAHGRAGVCVQCPMNQTGDLLRFFTKPVSEAVRKLLSRRMEWKLETDYDRDLGVCQVCNCPMKLKIWMPIAKIRSALKPETVAQLPGNCWIPKE